MVETGSHIPMAKTESALRYSLIDSIKGGSHFNLSDLAFAEIWLQILFIRNDQNHQRKLIKGIKKAKCGYYFVYPLFELLIQDF